MPSLPVRIDRRAPEPLGTQLARQLRELLVRGALTAGERLPSTRSLAAELGVGRSVTEQAYDRLIAEGLLETRRGAGTFVASAGARLHEHPDSPRKTHKARPIELDPAAPWIDRRHQAGWRRAWREVSVARPPRSYDDALGLAPLRVAVAERLGVTRGLVVDPDEIVVTAGTLDGWRQILQVLPAGPVAIEDPGHVAAVVVARGLGRTVVDVPAERPQLPSPRTSAIYVTPAHQHPMGYVMSSADRHDLLADARAAGTIIVEDDYDSEFRYEVAPIPALASLDRSVVAYLGTASKAVSPSLRLGWMVPPPGLLDPIIRHRRLTHDRPSWPAQRALLTLLRDGWVDQVVRSARRIYRERAPRVATALAPYGELAAPLAGMYGTWLLPRPSAIRARDHARVAGFEPFLLDYYCRTATPTGLVIGFGGVANDELDRAIAAIVRGLRG